MNESPECTDPFLKVLRDSIDDLEGLLELREDQQEMLHYSLGAILPLLLFGESEKKVEEFKEIETEFCILQREREKEKEK